MPRLTQMMPGMNPVMTRALYAERNYVDDKVEFIDTEHLMRTTFKSGENKKCYANDKEEIEEKN